MPKLYTTKAIMHRGARVAAGAQIECTEEELRDLGHCTSATAPAAPPAKPGKPTDTAPPGKPAEK